MTFDSPSSEMVLRFPNRPAIEADFRRLASTRSVLSVLGSYWMCMPEMARATMRRWISLVPSKIV